MGTASRQQAAIGTCCSISLGHLDLQGTEIQLLTVNCQLVCSPVQYHLRGEQVEARHRGLAQQPGPAAGNAPQRSLLRQVHQLTAAAAAPLQHSVFFLLSPKLFLNLEKKFRYVSEIERRSSFELDIHHAIISKFTFFHKIQRSSKNHKYFNMLLKLASALVYT